MEEISDAYIGVFFMFENIRNQKPNGYTMIIDKGIGLNQLRDLLSIGRPHLNFLKYGFGTSCLYDAQILIEKNQYLYNNNVISFPGGTLFEAAYHKKMVDSFLEDIIQNKFTGVEFSHGTIDVPDQDRYKYIRQAKDMHLLVFSELGKKNSSGFVNLIDSVKADLDAGSDFVILEGRDSGTSGLYTKDGEINDDILDVFDQHQELLPHIIWEAPCKDQQVLLLQKFGNGVNLGNIGFEDVISLAALRRGLRSDTFHDFL